MMTPKINIAAFFILVTFKISFVVCNEQVNYTKIPIGNCYKFFDYHHPNTWYVAKARCESDGGMMYYPNNVQEMETVFGALNVYTRMSSNTESDKMHIGYFDPNFDDLIKTVDGRHLTYVFTKWALGEPRYFCTTKFLKDGSCSCVQMKVESYYKYSDHEMSFMDCHYGANSFICNHRPNTNRLVVAATGELEPICPKSYIYVQIEENYYKYYPGLTSHINWYDAKAKCKSDGAELFHPDNLSELEQVFRELRNTSLSTRHSIFVGFSNLDSLGEYKTMDGRLLHDKYQKFSSFYPSDPNDDSNRCGSLLVADRYLQAVDCYNYQDFICKRRPPPVVKKVEKEPEYGDCYKFYDNEQWNHGAGKCTIEGSFMYYPNNELELETVLREMHIHTRMSNSSHLHVGYLDPNFDGRLMTVDGRRLTNVLKKWAPGEPKLNCTKKHLNLGDCSCVQIGVSSHEMSIIDCYKIGAYICNHKSDRKSYVRNTNFRNSKRVWVPMCPTGYTYIEIPIPKEENSTTAPK